MTVSKPRSGLAALFAATVATTVLLVTGAVAQGPVEITFWTWLPTIQKTIDKFEASHPNIKVKVENVGVGTDEYTKIQNAVDAGSGGPDVAHMTLRCHPQFRPHRRAGGCDQVRRRIGARPVPARRARPRRHQWRHLRRAAGFRSGVMYYRKDVFDAAGVEVPKTWAEYAAAAKAIHAKDPSHFITYLDPSLVDAAYMGLWQLSAEPWSISGGTDVTFNLQSDKARQWADYWTDLDSKGLTIESVQGSDEWFKQLGGGQIATWVVGAWGLQALTGVLPDNKGLWRVAPQPVWNAGDVGTSQFGGSGTVVLAQSSKKEAAVEFALWMNSSPEGVASLKDDQGLLPTTKAAWADPAFIDESIDYLGGQKARQIFAQSANDSVVGWTWLPFQPYVSSVYRDTVGQAISAKTSLFDGFKAWQDRISQYAKDQGFTVATK